MKTEEVLEIKDIIEVPVPVNSFVTMKEVRISNVTKGGIVLATTEDVRASYVYGEVCVLPKDARDMEGRPIKIEVKKGDIVLYGKVAANMWTHPQTGVKYFFIPYRNIISIVK